MKTLLPLALLLLSRSHALADTVSGTVRYENQIYDASGITGGTELLPVRLADVQIMRADGVILGSGTTAVDGTYSIAIPDGGSQSISVIVFARNTGPAVNAAVCNSPASGQVYGVATPVESHDTSAPITIDVDISDSTVAGVFNIFDCAVFGFQYVAFLEGSLPPSLPRLTLYWQSGSSSGGPAYSPATNAIFLRGLSVDRDEFDDDVILHEFGHFVSNNWGRSDSPGGAHDILTEEDPRLAWEEGWAHYFSAAARRYAETLDGFERYPAPQVSVNNVAGGAYVMDIEAPSFPDEAVGACKELAVASVLWDLADPANEPSDALPLDGAPSMERTIWAVIRQDLPAATSITLEDFVAGWFARISPAERTATEAILESRGILYRADDAEMNDTPSEATPIEAAATLTARTLFPAGDEDWYSVDLAPGPLAIETWNLGDGADTVLTLADEQGDAIATNDDRTPGDPSSLLTYSIAAAGSYRIRVASANRITRLGHYDLVVRGTAASDDDGVSTTRRRGCGAHSAPETTLIMLAVTVISAILNRRNA